MIDLSKARLPQNYLEMSQGEKVHTIIPVGRPPKTAFFQVNPDPEFSYEAYIFEYEGWEQLSILKNLSPLGDS